MRSLSRQRDRSNQKEEEVTQREEELMKRKVDQKIIRKSLEIV